MEFETPRLVLVSVSQEHTPAIYRYFTAGGWSPPSDRFPLPVAVFWRKSGTKSP